ncbi:uncharacterized protein EV422DRAFT_506986 [Fimicolochytrium jonesii]|uniref:uncharacterized protein n=1 Tax=Fimicolochytrium jonesii TaxID=1396493 RepID=UPI0022FEE43E|nr:uncharacterized protein EV422DRAFT_506986 [Fimicolochytrium jonesii]KAI8820279.1 hypothetical protein EV422DRAFT_506986 [Fimicolochytrium jonesii]
MDLPSVGDEKMAQSPESTSGTSALVPNDRFRLFLQRMEIAETKFFFADLPPRLTSLITLQNSHPLQDLSHIGEVTFLAAGLKAAVLISFPALGYTGNEELEWHVRSCIARYVSWVVMPALSEHKGSDADPKYKLLECSRHLRSPHTVELQGAFFVINLRHPKAAEVCRLLEHGNRTRPLTEQNLAFILDYPVSLPESDPRPVPLAIGEEGESTAWDGQVIREVAYVETTHGKPWTTYAAVPALHGPLIVEHFRRYQKVMAEAGVSLGMVTH